MVYGVCPEDLCKAGTIGNTLPAMGTTREPTVWPIWLKVS